MFSENDKISSRQFKRLLIWELFGLTTLLLPGLLCKKVGSDGMAALVVGIFFIMLQTILLCKIIQKAEEDIFEYIKKCFGKTASDFIILLFGVQIVLLGSFTLSLCVELIRSVLLQSMNEIWITITFWLICVYGARKGIECRGRMAEVVFWPFMILFAIVLLVAVRGVHTEYMSVILAGNEPEVLAGGYEVLAIFQGILFSLFALPYLQDKKKTCGCIRMSISWNAFLCACLFLVVIGVFGSNAAAAQKWPVIVLMTTTGVFGGFIRRLDVLMISIWIFSLFFLLSGCIFYVQRLTEKLLETGKNTKIEIVMALIILFGALVEGSRSMGYYIYKNYMFYVGIPLITVILLLLYIIGSIKGHRKN